MGLYIYDKDTKELNMVAGKPLAIPSIIEHITLNGVEIFPVNKTVALTVITNTVNNLVNYYTKSQTYTKTEVDSLIGNLSTLDMQIVESLPTSDISKTTIYLVATGTNNAYTQYAYIDGSWATLGTTEIDLSNYYTKDQIDALLEDKQDVLSFDSTPTNGSTNPVTSNGIFVAIKTVADIVAQHTTAIDTLNGDETTEGSVDKKIADALSRQTYLTQTIATQAQIDSFTANPETASFGVIYLLKDTSSIEDKYFQYQRIGDTTSSTFAQTGGTSVSLEDYFTKEEVNTLLSQKANSATTLNGYGILDAYTKAEVDAAKQSKVLDTPITVDGTQATNVEGALGALNTKKLNKTDISVTPDFSDGVQIASINIGGASVILYIPEGGGSSDVSVEQRLTALEYMVLSNDYYAPISRDGVLLADEDGAVILTHWKS